MIPIPRARAASIRRVARPVAAAALAFALALAAGAPPATAQTTRATDVSYESPQHFAFELRFGPFRPNIDSEFEGTGNAPYREFFGGGRHLMTQAELDYQLIRRYGTLGVGLGFGYFSVSGKNTLASTTGQKTADESTLRLYPLSVSAVYRLDELYRRFRVPLVPYGKLGLDYTIWSVNNGNDEVPQDPSGGTGRGGTLGWHAALGLSLVLDFFDPTTARQFDAEMGVNHTHLFFEFGHWDVSGLGASGKLRVGDTTWVAGLLFEF